MLGLGNKIICQNTFDQILHQLDMYWDLHYKIHILINNHQ